MLELLALLQPVYAKLLRAVLPEMVALPEMAVLGGTAALVVAQALAAQQVVEVIPAIRFLALLMVPHVREVALVPVVMAAALVWAVSAVTLRQVAVLVIQMMAQLGQLILFLMALELRRVLLVVAAVVLVVVNFPFVCLGLILGLMAQTD
jgi:hypothetical protein